MWDDSRLVCYISSTKKNMLKKTKDNVLTIIATAYIAKNRMDGHFSMYYQQHNYFSNIYLRAHIFAPNAVTPFKTKCHVSISNLRTTSASSTIRFAYSTWSSKMKAQHSVCTRTCFDFKRQMKWNTVCNITCLIWQQIFAHQKWNWSDFEMPDLWAAIWSTRKLKNILT